MDFNLISDRLVQLSFTQIYMTKMKLKDDKFVNIYQFLIIAHIDRPSV